MSVSVPIPTMLRLVSGWTDPINVQLLGDEEPIDLTGKTVELLLYEESGALFAFQGIVSTPDPITGTVRFTPHEKDLRAGTSRRVLYVRWRVEESGGPVYFFPNGDPDVWIISRPTLGTVSVAQPAMDPHTGDVRIYAGDDYDANDAYREIAWSSDSWPSLLYAGGLTLTVRHAETDAVAFTLTLAEGELDIVNEGEHTQTVRVLLLPADKSELLTDYGRKYRADVEAELEGGNKVTLVDATVIAARKQTRA